MRDLTIAIESAENAGVLLSPSATPEEVARAQAYATLALALATIALVHVNTATSKAVASMEREMPRIRGAMR